MTIQLLQSNFEVHVQTINILIKVEVLKMLWLGWHINNWHKSQIRRETLFNWNLVAPSLHCSKTSLLKFPKIYQSELKSTAWSAVVKQDGRDFSLYNILTQFSTFYLFFCCVSLSNCHFCVNMSANHITVEELWATFNKKLAPLKVLILAIILYFVTFILLFCCSYS